MKNILSFLAVVLPLIVAAQKSYTVEGSTYLKEGIAILNDYEHPDTVAITEGKFVFRGTIDNPTLISIQVPPSYGTRIILESGNITVVHSKDGHYRLGGSPLNIRFQYMEDAQKPLSDSVSKYWAIYNKTEDSGKLKAWLTYNQLLQAKFKKVKEMILADRSFAGLVEAVPICRFVPASDVGNFMNLFKRFSNEQVYKFMADYYKGAAATDSGILPPDWSLPDPEGRLISLSSLKGKYVLIDFWYSGCHWCRKMIPGLKNIYHELKDKGFEIVSVSVDPPKDEDKWRKAMQEDGAPWVELWDSAKELPDEYSVMGYPTMFFLDKDGKVLRKIIGYHDEPVLRSFFTKYIH